MSELKLNLIDKERVLHGTIHGAVADRCVAALSAEPETLAELEAALARYMKPRESHGEFASFHSTAFAGSSSPAFDLTPYDAGIVVIDLAARIVAIESSYSQPGPEGTVEYHDGKAATEVRISYRLPDDWLFVNSVDAWEWSRDRRIRDRAGCPPIDTRAILFGRPLLEFLVNAVLETPLDPVAENDEARAKHIRQIHARWLMTPRDDLRGQSPREVLFERREHIDFDLESRAEQWSLQNEGPPCLAVDSFAYRFAGYGTHEWVLYYDLIRHLLSYLLERRADRPTLMPEQFISELDDRKTSWLESPESELEGRVPAIIIDNERRRLPQALRPRDMIIDDDCPVCRMFGDETHPLGMGVGFWHLDGSHMDDEFPFSYCRTLQEWENENRLREEFDLRFAAEQERKRLASREMFDDGLFEHGAGRWGFDEPF